MVQKQAVVKEAASIHLRIPFSLKLNVAVVQSVTLLKLEDQIHCPLYFLEFDHVG